MTMDCLPLAVTCDAGASCYLKVDDLDDPEEDELTSEEIHVSVLAATAPEDLLFCFRLSTTSARALVNELTAAIARRSGGEPW
jgi:hypothetical protein